MKNAEFQIIAMSATFPNLHEVAEWLDAELYVTRMRPIAIREYIQTTHNNFKSSYEITQDKSGRFELQWLEQKKLDTTYKADPLDLWSLVQPLKEYGQVLIFCQTKRDCERYSEVFKERILDTRLKDRLIPEA